MHVSVHEYVCVYASVYMNVCVCARACVGDEAEVNEKHCRWMRGLLLKWVVIWKCETMGHWWNVLWMEYIYGTSCYFHYD